MKEEQKGYLYLVLFVLANGMVSVLAKSAEGLSAIGITFLRAVITIGFLFGVVLFTGKIKELKVRNGIPLFFVGICEGLSVFLYFSAIQMTSIANAIFLAYSAPVFSVIFARIFLKETIEKKTLIGLAAAMTGMFLIADPTKFSLQSNASVGNILALGSGVLYTAMAIFAKRVLKESTGITVVFWQYTVIAFMFVFFLPANIWQGFVTYWWQLLALGIVGTGISLVLFMEGVKRVKAQKVFIVASLEPVMATLTAFMFLKETPGIFTVIGGIIILYGVYTITRYSEV